MTPPPQITMRMTGPFKRLIQQATAWLRPAHVRNRRNNAAGRMRSRSHRATRLDRSRAALQTPPGRMDGTRAARSGTSGAGRRPQSVDLERTDGETLDPRPADGEPTDGQAADRHAGDR